MKSIDLNCDMGEGLSYDALLMPFISSANIACGYHAGNKTLIKTTLELCLKNNVAVGAHPGFNDRTNFGRTEIELNTEQLYNLMIEQLEIMQQVCNEMGAVLHHIKPHGALYNMAARNKMIAKTIANAVHDYNADLILYGLSGSHLITEAKSLQLKTASEVFADRTYQTDGSLTPRNQPNALIENEQQSLNQVWQMIKEGTVTTTNNQSISITAETICLHGDSKFAVDFAKNIFTYLTNNHIEIKPL